MNIRVDALDVTPIRLAPRPSLAALWIQRALKVARKIRPLMAASSVMVALLALWSVAPGLFTPYTPTDMDFGAVLQAPSSAHVFGTDPFGRDVFTLVVFGARQSLMVGLGVVAIGATVGSAIGLAIGYFGGWIDTVVMRLLEIWLSAPDILLVIIIATALKPGLGSLIVTMGVVSIPRYIRLLRAQAIAVKARPFVEVSRAVGSPHLAILVKHVAPHAASLLLVIVTLGVGRAMLAGAGLSFIGLGVIEDRPDWGALLSEGRAYVASAWWFTVFPGLAITLMAIALNVLGEALRLRFDPRAQQR